MAKTQINFRIEVSELGEWQKAASLAGKSLTEWVRGRCNEIPGTVLEIKAESISDKSVLERGKVGPPGLERPVHDKSCQCGICGFRREVLK